MVYLLLADGFEEIEALTPLDVLRRCGVGVTAVGVGGEYIASARGLTVKADTELDGVSAVNAEMLIVPGGYGYVNIGNSKEAVGFIRSCYESGAYIAAICGAPTVLGKMGLLNGKKAVCFPGLEKDLIGAELSNEAVVIDGKIITSKAAGTSHLFAFALAKILCGEEKSEEVRRKMCWQ